MPGFDFASAVPVDAVALWNAVVEFMSMPIVGAILMSALGMSLGVRFYHAFTKLLTSRGGGYHNPDLIGAYNGEFSTDRDTDHREALAQEYRRARLREQFDETAGAHLSLYQSHRDIGPLTDDFENADHSRDFWDWLDDRTADLENRDEIVDAVQDRSYLRFQNRMRENDRAQDDYFNDLASETAV